MNAVSVVGGTYIERCADPTWDEILGSGLRGALVLRQLGAAVTFTTVSDAAHARAIAQAAREAGIEPAVEQSAQLISFSYRHALARPFIDPPLHRLKRAGSLQVSAPCVLRYGMLDGDAVVRAETAVYDPQNSEDPARFSANGSHAFRLAIVANSREAKRLTGIDDPRAAAAELRHAERAEVVVLKRGASGCLVLDATGATEVPAYFVNHVFPIGSGDVFSAAFASAWALQGKTASEAADFASRSTATYCAAPQSLLAGAFLGPSEDLRPIRPSKSGKQRQVYLAGPFFSTGQRWLVEEALTALRNQHVRVFSPFHEIGIGPAEEVAKADIVGLEASHSVLALVDGRDAGTLFELGWARARGIPVVAFVQNEPEEPLKMLVGTGCQIVDDFVSAVYRAAWAALER